MNRRIREWLSSWSNQDEDSRNAFLLIAGIAVVVVIAIGLAVFGALKERGEDTDAVVVVGGQEVPYSYFEKRVRPYMRGDNSVTPEQFSQIVSGLIAEVEQEKLLFHVAKTRGIEVKDEDIDAEMREDLGVSPDATKEVFATSLRRELLETGLSLEQYRNMQRAQVIEDRIREDARAAVPAEAEQVDIRLAQFDTIEKANEAKTKLDGGDSLSTIAATMSIHSSSTRAGEINWVARGSFAPKLEEAMFAQEVGTTSGIIETDEGFFIVEVRGKETRTVDDPVRNLVVARTFGTALQEARDDIGSEIVMTTAQLQRLASRFSTSLTLGG